MGLCHWEPNFDPHWFLPLAAIVAHLSSARALLIQNEGLDFFTTRSLSL